MTRRWLKSSLRGRDQMGIWFRYRTWWTKVVVITRQMGINAVPHSHHRYVGKSNRLKRWKASDASALVTMSQHCYIVIHKYSIIILNDRLKPRGQPTTTLHGWTGYTSHAAVSRFLLLSERQLLPNGVYNILIKHDHGKSPTNRGFKLANGKSKYMGKFLLPHTWWPEGAS